MLSSMDKPKSLEHADEKKETSLTRTTKNLENMIFFGSKGAEK
jgi:hypothetical protein